ncbi:MAG: hypothetical protein HeimC2_45440 [Candidatus Heimdallarchaeota archaeon LC_2]|nr:MAG: hypothetical protein HeimC2_45440 [Candidatus Heimdallarchaeota archaeon LC_2]
MLTILGACVYADAKRVSKCELFNSTMRAHPSMQRLAFTLSKSSSELSSQFQIQKNETPRSSETLLLVECLAQYPVIFDDSSTKEIKWSLAGYG